jgi:hypothetical protein
MAAPKRVKRKDAESVETVSDAWERFESAVDQVAPPRSKADRSRKDQATGDNPDT